MGTAKTVESFNKEEHIFEVASIDKFNISITIKGYEKVVGSGVSLHDALNDLHKNKDILFAKQYVTTTVKESTTIK